MVWLIAPTRVITPYVQFGRIRPDGSGWYTTQGVFLAPESPSDFERGGGTFARVPALAYQTASGPTTIHFFATGAFGRERELCSTSGHFCEPGSDRWVLASGVTIAYHVRLRAKTPTRPPARP